jgi:hypothetical protein
VRNGSWDLWNKCTGHLLVGRNMIEYAEYTGQGRKKKERGNEGH